MEEATSRRGEDKEEACPQPVTHMDIYASHTFVQIHTRKPHTYTHSYLFTTVP